MLTAKRPRLFHLPLRTFKFYSFGSTKGGFPQEKSIYCFHSIIPAQCQQTSDKYPRGAGSLRNSNARRDSAGRSGHVARWAFADRVRGVTPDWDGSVLGGISCKSSHLPPRCSQMTPFQTTPFLPHYIPPPDSLLTQITHKEHKG